MNPTLSLSLANSNGVVVDPYWLRMGIKKDQIDDGMTGAEAAALIDSVYNIKPCEQQGPTDIWDQGDAANTNTDIWSGAENTSGVDEETLAAQKRFVAKLLTEGYGEECGTGLSIPELIAYDVVIQIYRSHRNELYKLQVASGIASGATRCRDRVVVIQDVEEKTSVTLDMPIIDRPVVRWMSGVDAPEIHIIGNTLFWDGAFTGTIRAEFDTEWDEVTIHVTGDPVDSEMLTGTDTTVYGVGWYSGTESGDEIDDYQDIQCSVLGFYHFQYEELILNRPEEDESTSDVDKLNFCHFVTSIAGSSGGGDSESDRDEDEETPECRRHVNEHIICECGGIEGGNNHYEMVPCPDGVTANSLLDGVERTRYMDCGYRDKVHDPAFYEATCCESWPFVGFNEKEMPHCERMVKGFTRKPLEESDIEKEYPEGTTFIRVSPGDGKCGEWTITQRIIPRQCCDDVEPLVVSEESAEVLAPESWGTIAVTGGKMPVTFKINGTGISFAGGRNEITVDGKQATVITDEDFCGMAYWSAKDGCSSVGGSLRSTQGHWEHIDPDSLGDVEWTPTEVYMSGYDAGTCGGSWYTGIAYKEKYKVSMTFATYVLGNPTGCTALPYRPIAESLILTVDALHSTEPAQLIKRGAMAALADPEDFLFSGENGYFNNSTGWGYWRDTCGEPETFPKGGAFIQLASVQQCINDGSAEEWTC